MRNYKIPSRVAEPKELILRPIVNRLRNDHLRGPVFPDTLLAELSSKDRWTSGSRSVNHGPRTGTREYGNIAGMKTTIDLPDALYRRLKIRAAESGVTIRHLVVQGIERELGGATDKTPEALYEDGGQERHSYVDEQGWPVLKRSADDRTVITNEFVNRLREEEGV